MSKMNNQNVDKQLNSDETVKKNFQNANLKVLGFFLLAFFGGTYYFFKDPDVKETIHAKKQFKDDEEIRVK